MMCPMKYRSVDERFIAKFRDLTGHENVLSHEIDLIPYAFDCKRMLSDGLKGSVRDLVELAWELGGELTEKS